MHKPELVASLVTSARSALKEIGLQNQKTVSVKIRIHKDLRETVDFVRIMEDAGVDFITVHGRLRSTPSSQPVNLNAIKLIKEHANVPVIANGDVFSLEDVGHIVDYTRVDGVMAARGILQNPALFHEKGMDGCPWEAVEVFLGNTARAPLPFKLVVHHLGEMCGTDHTQKKKPLLTKEERLEMMECRSMIELLDYLDTIRKIRRDFER
jgi:tRNA-dihydrouridine synthase 4